MQIFFIGPGGAASVANEVFFAPDTNAVYRTWTT